MATRGEPFLAPPATRDSVVTATPPCPPLPRVIGHRGAAAHAPENTLAGLATGARLGARWVEVDVRLSTDGLPFLLHDETLERTTDGHGPASALDAAALARLDAGSRFGPAFAGEPVPTLAAVLALVARSGLGIVLEVKPDASRERELLAALGSAVDACPPAALLVSSSDPAVLREAARVLPRLPRAIVLDEPPAEGWPLVHDLGCCSVHCWERWLRGPELERALAAGVVAAYTVNDATRALELFDAGVRAVFSDRPDVILAAVSARG